MNLLAGRKYLFHFATFFLLFFSSFFAFAGPGKTTYQAKIVKPDGYPLEATSVNFKFTILDPAGSCILYSETYSSVNMSSTGGLISFALGSGVKTYPVSATTFEQVFSNITPSLSCDTGGPANYSPTATDIRKIVMQFHDGTGWQTLPAMNINAVPYAMYANEATKLNGLTSSDFVQLSTVPTCAASEALRYTGAGFSCVAVGNSVTSSTVVTALGYTPADGASLTTVTSDLSTVSSTVAGVSAYASSVSSTVFSVSSTVTSLQNSVAASFAAITSSQWTTSGTNIFYNTGNIGIGTTTPVTTLDVSGGVRIGAESTTCAPALAGTLRYNASNVEYCNGTSWQAFGVSGAGLQSFNGSTSGTQSFATGTGGTAPAFNTSNGVHTLNLPLASTGAVTAGLLSNADYTTFTNKITSSAASIAQVLGYVPADNAASGTYAQKANNLSDLTNIATARTNLGLGTFATASSIDLGSASATGTLAIARLPAFNGDATIAAASNTIILANSGVTAGTYTKVTVDSKGRVTSSAALASSDVTTALGYTPANSATTVSSQWSTSGTTINYMTGNVGIGTTNPQEKLHVEGGALLVTGDWGSGPTLTVSGAGTRMFFYPRKAAFRGGYVYGDEWNESNIGEASFAFGDSAVASGAYSVAMGRNAKATAPYSTAFGQGEASGDYSTAFDSSTAYGLYSVALGSSSAQGDRAIAMGGGSSANGESSVAIGRVVISNAYRSVAVGSYNIGNGSGTAWIATDPIFEIGNSQNGLPRTNAMTVLKNGNVGITVSAPTARLHLASGTTALAPLKFTTGVLLSSPQSGAMEYDGTNFYLTDSTNTRRAIATGSSAGTIDNASNINSSGNITLTPVGSVIVSATTASTNSSTGALVVKGGLGVAGSVNTAGNLNVSGSSVIDGSLTLSGMTSGSVLFAGASGVVSQDNGNFFWDGVNKRLGVGTSAPTQRFENAGTRTAFGRDGASWHWFTTNTGTTEPANLSMGFSASAGTVTQFAILTNGVHRMDVTSGGLVGIGTENPAGILHVNGAGWGDQTAIPDTSVFPTSGTGGVIIDGNYSDGRHRTRLSSIDRAGGLSLYVQRSSGAANVFSNIARFGDHNQSTMEFEVFGDAAFSGNVGIGTTTPAAKLDVNGSAIIRGGLLRQTFGDSGAAAQWVKLGRWTVAQQGRNATIRLEGGNGFNAIFDQISAVEIRLRTSNAVSVDANGFCASAVYQVLGRNPMVTAVKLVGNAAGCSATAYDVYVNAQNFTGVGSFFTADADASTTWTTDVQFGVADPGSASSSVYIVTAETTLNNNFHVNANVGIGTTSPVSKLNVQADTDFLNGSGSAQLHITGSTNSNKRVRIGYDTTANKGAIQALTYGTSYDPLLVNPSGGNVGIGTSSPATRLDVAGGGGSIFQVVASSNTTPTPDVDSDFLVRLMPQTTGSEGGHLEFKGSSSYQDWVIDSTSGDLRFFEPNQSRTVTKTRGGFNFMVNSSTTSSPVQFTALKIMNSGNVGIATSTPSSYQHGGTNKVAEIYNSATAANSQSHFILSSGNTTNADSSIGSISFAQPNMSDANKGLGFIAGRTDTDYTQANPTSLLAFATRGASETNWSQKMIIKGNGNVGIGTATPRAKFEVANGANSDAAILATSNESNRLVVKSWDTQPTAVQTFGIVHNFNGDENNGFVKFHRGGSTSGGFLTMGTNGIERLRVNTSGDVGLGTASPTAKLNIGGLGAADATALRIDSQDTYYRDIFMSEFNTTTYGGILRYHSGLDLLQLITLENGVEKYGVAVARATGFVGMGMNSAAQYQLDVNGDIRITGTPYRAGGDIAWTVPSDARLKDVVRKYDRGLNEILNIDTIIYRYKKGNVKDIDPTKEFSGVLAQQVQQQIPEAVKMDKDGFLSLNTTPIFWAMLNAIKEIYHQVLDVMRNDEAQNRAIASVKEENTAIKAENEKIKQENAEIKAYLCAKDPSAPMCK